MWVSHFAVVLTAVRLDCAEAEVSEGNFCDVVGGVLGYCAELFFCVFFC